MTFVELSLADSKQPTNVNKMANHHQNIDPTTLYDGSTHGTHISRAVGRIPRKSRRSHGKLSIHIPHSIHDMSDNYLVKALSQTTLLFCRETTLHGMKHVVDDIEELGSTFSRYNYIFDPKLLDCEIVTLYLCMFTLVYIAKNVCEN